MRKILILLSLFPLFTFGQNQICENLSTENFTGLTQQINTYLITHNLDSLGENKVEIKFKELDSIIDYLSQLNCIDSAYYRWERGMVMKTGILMADILLSSNNEGLKKVYIIRLRFENYTKVVFFREGEY